MNRFPRSLANAGQVWPVLAALPALAAGIAAAPYIPAGPFTRGPGLVQKLLAWDAGWYENIALTGYHWRPDGAIWSHNQNIAFFPLFPLIERALNAIAPGVTPWSFILAGLAFGIASNVTFLNLARSLLPEQAARRATLLFALWPAACFLAFGYPTGLINLCTIACLRHRLEGRTWRAVIWAGIGTAVSPTAVFVAVALGLDLAYRWWQAGVPPSAIPRLAAQGMIAIAGLLAFMLFQSIVFGDPSAFIKAQGGFDPASPTIDHVIRLFNPIWYILPVDFAWNAVMAAVQNHLAATAQGRQTLNISFQWMLDLMSVALTLMALLSQTGRNLPPIIKSAGWCVLFGFLWFTATSPINVTNGMRMLFPEFPLFLVLGVNASQRQAAVIALIFTLLTAIDVGLVIAGYGVT